MLVLGEIHDDISVSVFFEFLLSAGMKDKMVGLRKNGLPLLNFWSGYYYREFFLLLSVEGLLFVYSKRNGNLVC